MSVLARCGPYSLVLVALLSLSCSSDAERIRDLEQENATLREQLAQLQPAATPTVAPTTDPDAPPPPGAFEVATTTLTRNIIGQREANIRIRNIGGETIDAFDLRICAYDTYGEPVPRFGAGSHCFIGLASDVLVRPDQTYRGKWTLHGQDSTDRVEVTPVRSHTRSGETWEP